MDPDNKDRFPAKAFCKEKILEGPEHHSVLEKEPDRSDRHKKSGRKDHKGDLYIVHGYPGKHVQGIFLFIYAKGVSACDIFFRHVYIAITQHAPDKGLVMRCGESSHDTEKKKDGKGIKDHTMVSANDHREICFPEPGYPGDG